MDKTISYRATMFDGEPDLAWLRPGWRALRLYAQKAKAAIEDGDTALKADMISRADQLLTIMSGILEINPGSMLGSSLMRIYSALRLALLDANMSNTCEPLVDFDRALRTLDDEFLKLSEGAAGRR
ncbi:MAG TPA: flagellar protein FliS [Acidisoma sp.]|jgi:flagellin-specific chaperone FliS|uniref:flagellar protein FliS n=1 Tax=Acidisoma sp. TaxID=1872115 RepID=UPI002CA7BD59|nr:flagellar protein FliS [Acidisoma sp.]HTI00227.1 flagellar protein FliS [Acidisoma sp.]